MDTIKDIKIHYGALPRCRKSRDGEHEWESTYLSDDLAGFRCTKCGHEVVDIPDDDDD